MTQQESAGTSLGTQAGARAPVRSHPFPRLPVAAAGFVAGAAIDYLIGLDALWPMLTAGIIACLLVLAGDALLARTHKSSRAAQVAVVLAIALGVGLFYRHDRDSAFRDLFDIAPPPGVSHVDTDRLRARDSGRSLLILQFSAPRDAVDKLLAPRQFIARKEYIIPPGKEAKQQRAVWSNAFAAYGAALQDRWKNRLPVLEPHIWHWIGRTPETIGRQASVLWDGASGRGYAVLAGPGPAGSTTNP